MTDHRFTYLGREWIGRWVVNEANTRILPKITAARKGPPWPAHEEYRGAMTAFQQQFPHD